MLNAPRVVGERLVDMVVKCTAEQIEDGTLGGCVACGEIQEGCEPDARGYECDSCGAHKVYGLEELLIMGRVELVGGEEEEEGEDDLAGEGDLIDE